MTVPARILVMGPAGELYIHNEADDRPAVEYHRLLFEKANDRHRGPGGGPELGPVVVNAVAGGAKTLLVAQRFIEGAASSACLEGIAISLSVR